MTGLSTTRMQGVRQELVDKGYLHYSKGSGNQCGTYTIIDLTKEAPNPPKKTQADTAAVPLSDNSTDNTTDNTTDNSADNSTDNTTDTLNKPTKLKPTQSKMLYGDFVTLTPAEHTKLSERLGQSQATRYIERLNEYIGQIGEKTAKKRYKSHYHTLLGFYRRDQEKAVTAPNTTPNSYTQTKGESL